MALGGSDTVYTYDPDDDSVPGVQAVSESEEERRGAEEHSYGLSDRLRGGSTDSQETAQGRAMLGSECASAAGAVCAAESALIRPSATVDDDPVPEASNNSGQRALGDRSNAHRANAEGGGASSSSSSSSNYGSSSDEDFDFELEEPPADALRPSASPSAASPDVIGVELPPGYTPGESTAVSPLPLIFSYKPEKSLRGVRAHSFSHTNLKVLVRSESTALSPSPLIFSYKSEKPLRGAGRSIGPLAAAASGALDLLQQQYTQDPASLRVRWPQPSLSVSVCASVCVSLSVSPSLSLSLSLCLFLSLSLCLSLSLSLSLSLCLSLSFCPSPPSLCL